MSTINEKEIDYLVDLCEFHEFGKIVWGNGVCHIYQFQQKIRYQNLEIDQFTMYQNFLYRRCLFGLNVYTEEEVRTMHYDKKERIKKVHRRAQIVLNLWKQQITNSYFNQFIRLKIEYKGAEEFLAVFQDVTDINFICKFDFKSLKITKEIIILKLMMEGILPKDFHQLKTVPVSQPIVRLRGKKDAL